MGGYPLGCLAYCRQLFYVGTTANRAAMPGQNGQHEFDQLLGNFIANDLGHSTRAVCGRLKVS